MLLHIVFGFALTRAILDDFADGLLFTRTASDNFAGVLEVTKLHPVDQYTVILEFCQPRRSAILVSILT